jgi:phosphatidylserine/phosphatidylglycerophosphate/cardiolipin synthase-like enzyme
MAAITRARAFANNEVALLAWGLDVGFLPGCLGFHIVRQTRKADGHFDAGRPLASYVAFKGQRNQGLKAQNTTVWPVQKFIWRDLTLRRKRDGSGRRVAEQQVRYQIRAVGRLEQGLEPVITVEELAFGAHTPNTYQGTPIPLGYLTPPAVTNTVVCTANRPPFTSTFTNGILSTQLIVNILTDGGTKRIDAGDLEERLKATGDELRRYLSGDVLPLIRDFFGGQPAGRFHAALYELDDDELVELLEDNAHRISLILSDAGKTTKKRIITFDSRNKSAREKLRTIATQPGSTFQLADRMFNGSGHIGHNKFVVHVDGNGSADSVLTGSTNWTWSGVAGQSNNCIRIDDPVVADAYLRYWQRLAVDTTTWPEPNPLTARAAGAGQSDNLKAADVTPCHIDRPDGSWIEVWFSPNVPNKSQPPSRDAAVPPPDMARLFSMMRKASRAILFLVFLPSKGGMHSIVSEAVSLGVNDPSLDVIGAVSDTQAMWGYREAEKTKSGNQLPAWSPHVFKTAGVHVVRATALSDAAISHEIGDFRTGERLAAEKAIIHDKILVIDPMDPADCIVAFGSHNLGYKASYSNDENLVIVKGMQDLALAYAAHVLDVYDHYRFRAAEAQAAADTKAGKKDTDGWDGFLDRSPEWQKKSSHRLADYFSR